MKKRSTGLGRVLLLIMLYSCIASIYITRTYIMAPIVEYQQNLTQSADNYMGQVMASVDIPSVPYSVGAFVQHSYSSLRTQVNSYVSLASVGIFILLWILLFLGNISAVLLYTLFVHLLVKHVIKQRFTRTLLMDTYTMIVFNVLSLCAVFEAQVIVKFVLMLGVNLCCGFSTIASPVQPVNKTPPKPVTQQKSAKKLKAKR